MQEYAWDKIELLYDTARRAEARASMIVLDLYRTAQASTLSPEGHKLYKSVRAMLSRQSASKEGLKPEKIRAKVAQKIIAMGGQAMPKPS